MSRQRMKRPDWTRDSLRGLHCENGDADDISPSPACLSVASTHALHCSGGSLHTKQNAVGVTTVFRLRDVTFKPLFLAHQPPKEGASNAQRQKIVICTTFLIHEHPRCVFHFSLSVLTEILLFLTGPFLRLDWVQLGGGAGAAWYTMCPLLFPRDLCSFQSGCVDGDEGGVRQGGESLPSGVRSAELPVRLRVRACAPVCRLSTQCGVAGVGKVWSGST